MARLLKNRIFLVVLGIILFFIILNFIIPRKYLLDPLRNFLFRLTMPITSVFYRGGQNTGGFFSKIGEIRRLADEKNELEKKNAALEIQNSKLEEALKENELLRAQLGLKNELKDKELVAADIVGREPTNIGSNLIINKGKKDGLSTGMPVVSGSMLLGKLSLVDDDFSRVVLIIDPSSVVNVMVEETRSTGILKGEVGSNLKIDSVPRENPLKIGQRIITSGLGGTMPKGLIVGAVQEIISPESEVFQSAKVKPQADLNHLEIVFIIKT